jgi:hypothetical protein
VAPPEVALRPEVALLPEVALFEVVPPIVAVQSSAGEPL